MDIISLPVEVDKKAIDGKFRLATIAAQRAKELALGAKTKIQTKSKKVASIAIEEAVAGKLDFLVGEEARKACQEARKFDFRRQLEARKKEGAYEDLTELEKDLKIYLNEKESADREALEKLFMEKTDDLKSAENSNMDEDS